MHNLILNTDSYKTSHYLQYPHGIGRISSYIESRGGKYPATLFFGLQMFLKQYLSKPVTQQDLDEAVEVCQLHGVPFNTAGWQRIIDQHQGYLPLEIQAVAEGELVPVSNVLVQVINTDPDSAWLTSYIETALIRAVWYPTTVATISHYCKDTIDSYLQSTAENSDDLAFKLHDFGARGASSEEASALGGIAHLVSFMGSDNLSGVMAARRYYDEPMAGFSIPAAEHSTITSWGREGEQDAYANMLKQFGGEGKLVAVVSDSYDLWNAIDNIWGKSLKEQVINSGGTLVVRPDSGNPVSLVPEAVEKLMDIFGYTTNSKGYKLLPKFIRLIQGDGVSPETIRCILESMKQRGLSAANLTFGMGAELLQKVNRDTQRFAMKASAIEDQNGWRDIFKDPITDPGKKSKAGRLALILKDGVYTTVREDQSVLADNQLRTVYHNGKLFNQITFSDVRKRAASK
ncbi:nicotinate phosphoribosyltransferase [Pelagibaculum spongiae]|uniref:Nicotinamide phosphoribosyltransferase n=1 Tax=Pelagibaculum spongiae TaxID=2080658 RepID=A0A2V1GRD7_9GAMM|nr:nicotinate phosphoribosyltransferase [Pelagibaculum spongiae]PVZ66333.1 nicotinate phosphoribosyltransferase [Pelagibaculum spongiae]